VVQGRDLGRFVDSATRHVGPYAEGVASRRRGPVLAPPPLPSVRPNDRVRSACNFWMPIDNKSAQSPDLHAAYAARALSAALGFLATMVKRERAAGSGSTRPCSQLRNVDSGMRIALANSF
jgi:hypothetical protein